MGRTDANFMVGVGAEADQISDVAEINADVYPVGATQAMPVPVSVI